MYTAEFWKAAFERAVGSFCGPLAGGLVSASLWDVEWKTVVGIGGSAALVSLVASLGKAGIGPKGPGLTETTTTVKSKHRLTR